MSLFLRLQGGETLSCNFRVLKLISSDVFNLVEEASKLLLYDAEKRASM